MIKLLASFFLVSTLLPSGVKSFSPASGNIRPSTSLFAKKASNQFPVYDKVAEKWVATSPEQEGGYGVVGSLLRAGPLPFFARITKPDVYEQSVLKYMATDKCDRQEAQGNMDAFNENPGDWQYQKLQEKAGKPKRDYGNLDVKKGALAITWAIGITGVLGYLGVETVRISNL